MKPVSVSTKFITRWGSLGNQQLGQVLNHLNRDGLKDVAIRHLVKDMQQLIDRAVHDAEKKRGWP